MRAAARAFAVASSLAAASFVAGGCSLSDLSAASFVEGLRVLGVQAEPPEALPGQTVTLTAWTVDTGGRAIDVAWSECLLPSNGTANPACTDGSGNGLVALGSGASVTLTVPTLDASTYGPTDATYGVYLPIVAHAAAGSDSVDVVYRLRVRATPSPGCPAIPPPPPDACAANTNPAFVGIDPLGDEGVSDSIPTYEGQFWGLVAHYTDDSNEAYDVPARSPPLTRERLTTQWFATAGSFPDQPVGGTAVQKWTLDSHLPPLGAPIDLWIVGHDDRGGTTIAHRSFMRVSH